MDLWGHLFLPPFFPPLFLYLFFLIHSLILRAEHGKFYIQLKLNIHINT